MENGGERNDANRSLTGSLKPWCRALTVNYCSITSAILSCLRMNDGKRLIKKIAAYHQFHAVRKR
jgi:hypothetical protein